MGFVPFWIIFVGIFPPEICFLRLMILNGNEVHNGTDTDPHYAYSPEILKPLSQRRRNGIGGQLDRNRDAKTAP